MHELEKGKETELGMRKENKSEMRKGAAGHWALFNEVEGGGVLGLERNGGGNDFL